MRVVVRRPVATLALTLCLLVSCSNRDDQDRQREPPRAPDVSVTPSADSKRSPVAAPDPQPAATPAPTVPAIHDAAALAEQIDAAVATLRDGSAAPADVRRAGELQQLAVKALVTAPRRFRAEVFEKLSPDTARVTRSDVSAGRDIRALNRPQPHLPDWRIVAPPPAVELLAYYRAAQRRTGVPWNYLAAINLVETRMGRIRGVSTAGARGPMQFLQPTWDLYGAGGDINDPRDAIFAAARLLKANGAPADMAEALWHYNPSDHYVRAVSEHASNMQRSSWAYRGYWSWRVLFPHTRGTYLLPVGYPREHALLLR